MDPQLIIGEPLPVEDPLAEWRWKIGGSPRVVLLSRSGDAFLIQPGGEIDWLDTGGGRLERIAQSRAEFDRVLKQPAEAARLLLSPVVEQSIQRDGPFPAGVCLGFTQLPIIGGTYTLDNRWRVSAVEHFGVTGDLHRQMRDLPGGAEVRIRVVD